MEWCEIASCSIQGVGHCDLINGIVNLGNGSACSQLRHSLGFGRAGHTALLGTGLGEWGDRPVWPISFAAGRNATALLHQRRPGCLSRRDFDSAFSLSRLAKLGNLLVAIPRVVLLQRGEQHSLFADLVQC